MDPLRVLLVTSWGTSCGIAEHSALLKESAEAADPDLEVWSSSETLDPAVALPVARGYHLEAGRFDLVHLNHHDGLHSRWTAADVRELRRQGIPVVVTYHDTRERLADCPKLEALAAVADAVVVHEPVEGLAGPTVHYWRQGVPAPAERPANYQEGISYGRGSVIPGTEWLDGRGMLHLQSEDPFKAFPQQPVLGTIGFNFPWKNFDRLARETRDAGWALVILSTNATEEDEARWKGLNPDTLIIRGHRSTPEIVNYLAGCDATAFMYECANTGTSGAIRLGIAARKPVIALETCRQFRDLYQDLEGYRSLYWVSGWEAFRGDLRDLSVAHLDLSIHALATQDSWARLGARYADLYRAVVADTRTARGPQ